MHLFGIEESDVVFRMACPACDELVGLSMEQVETGIKRDGFAFTCPKGGGFTIPDLVLLREYTRLLIDVVRTSA